jgi:hypothetical protein
LALRLARMLEAQTFYAKPALLHAVAALFAAGRGVMKSQHSTKVESPLPPLRLRMSIHPEGKSKVMLRFGSSASC